MKNLTGDQYCARPWTRQATLTGTLALALLGGGCGDILSLKQENPGQLTADAVYTPSNAQLMVNGAIADFECSFIRYVLGGAIMGDELGDALQNTELYDLDRRTIRPTPSASSLLMRSVSVFIRRGPG